MSYFEKINIYVPETVGRVLENDAMLFEIFKKDGRTINKNRFLSMLIRGYYNTYEEETQKVYAAISEKLNKLIGDDDTKKDIVTAIINEVFRPKVPARKGKKPARWSLKPTVDTEGMINQIMDNLGGDDYISQYFCRLLMSYCEMPFSKRERIVFSSNYEMIENAIINGQGIMFNTIWDGRKNHYVFPYKLVVGREEMFNYLLCCEKDERTGKLQAKSYRLNRIAKIDYSSKVVELPALLQEKLDKMIEYAPQFAINDDEECCVRLNEYGIKLFNRIYYGRPQVECIEERDDGMYYFFNCSEDQIYLYFKRFEGDSAEVIYPKRLRTRIKKFFADVSRKYEEDDYE